MKSNLPADPQTHAKTKLPTGNPGFKTLALHLLGTEGSLGLIQFVSAPVQRSLPSRRAIAGLQRRPPIQSRPVQERNPAKRPLLASKSKGILATKVPGGGGGFLRHCGMAAPSMLLLYRHILKAAKLFPSIKRNGIIQDIKTEFRDARVRNPAY